jgi:hypothetical protein
MKRDEKQRDKYNGGEGKGKREGKRKGESEVHAKYFRLRKSKNKIAASSGIFKLMSWEAFGLAY